MTEDRMNDLTQDATYMTPRRDFFGHMAGAVALGIAGAAPTPLLRAGRRAIRWAGLAGSAQGTSSPGGGCL